VDLTNQTFGNITVIGRGEDYVSPSGSLLLRWKCRCNNCGNETNMTTSQIKRGQQCSSCTSHREDLTGHTFGQLTVLSAAEDYVSPKGSRMGKWHCKCACGNEVDVLGMSLKNGDTKSCGCLNNSKKKACKRINPNDVISQRYGYLTVLDCVEEKETIRKSKFKCLCDCGKEVVVGYSALTKNHNISCGCKNKKTRAKTHIKPRNIIGTKIGEVEIIDEKEPHITPNGSKQRIVIGRCSCGNVFQTRLAQIKKSGKCFTCSCISRRVDITGNRYGKLVVLSMAEDYISPSGTRLARCYCKCDCGNTIVVNMSALITGSTQSCGCLHNTQGLLKDNPELVEKYDFEKNQAEGIEFDTLTARTSRKIWWKCKECGNSWFATIASQNDKIIHGCPYCSGRFVIEGKTDLASQCPEILNEWDYVNNELKPNEVSKNSSQKVWWKCKECGHLWKAVVSNRVRGAGCPKCNIENVNSFCEQATFFYIKQIFPDAINGDKHIGMELDIYIPSLNVAIEYDGEAWHKSASKERIDIHKNEVCKENGIELIRIREPKLPPIEGCTVFIREDSTSSLSLDCIIGDVIKYFTSSAKIDIDTTRDTPYILEQYAAKKYNNSLAAMYPEIAAEWHPTKNGMLTPDKVNKASGHKVWWLGKCGHEWQMSISDRTLIFTRKNGRTKTQYGCPYCSGKRILEGFNDLASQYPEIANEWHPTKNYPLTPNQVSKGSSHKVWWLGKCGHEWEQVIGSRTGNKQGCPICWSIRRNKKKVRNINTNETFDSIREAGTKYQCSPNQISYCCKGKQETAGGYHWEYISESPEN